MWYVPLPEVFRYNYATYIRTNACPGWSQPIVLVFKFLYYKIYPLFYAFYQGG